MEYHCRVDGDGGARKVEIRDYVIDLMHECQ